MERKHGIPEVNNASCLVPPTSCSPLRKKTRRTENSVSNDHGLSTANQNENAVNAECPQSPNASRTERGPDSEEYYETLHQNLLNNGNFDIDEIFHLMTGGGCPPGLQLLPAGCTYNNMGIASSQSSSVGYDDASVPQNQFENVIDELDNSANGEFVELLSTKEKKEQQQVGTNLIQPNENQEIQELLKTYLKDPASLQRFHMFLHNDITSHLISSGRVSSNVSMAFSRLSQDCPRQLVELFRKALIETNTFQNLGTEMSQTANNNCLQVQTRSQEQEFSESNAVASIYDKIKPILEKVSSTMAMLGGPKIADPKKVITTFGKKLFDAVFDTEEILGGCARNKNQSREYDQNKICTIARFIAWILSDPDNLTIESFAIYEEHLAHKKDTGLDSTNLKYSKDNVVVKYGCDRRAELLGKR